jgi:outer membrane protein assembly factor BamB
LTDNKGTIYCYDYNRSEPIASIERVGLYFLNGESHWIDDSHSLHLHGREGVRRNRIIGKKYICLFDWNKENILWKVEPKAIKYGYAICQEKFVYQAGSDDGSVHCLDLHSGETCWVKSPHELIEYSDDEKERYDRWQKAIAGNPRIYNNLVIVGMPFFRIIAIDIESGEKVWEYKLSSEEYDEPLANIESRPYEMAVTESGSVYRIESADVVCGYDKHCHRLFLIELDAMTANLIQRTEVKALEGDLQKHIIDPFEKDVSFGQEKYCDVTETHYLTSFEGGLIMAINLETGIVDWHTTLPSGTPFGPFFVLNNRFYTSTGWNAYVFEGEGGYMPD